MNDETKNSIKHNAANITYICDAIRESISREEIMFLDPTYGLQLQNDLDLIIAMAERIAQVAKGA